MSRGFVTWVRDSVVWSGSSRRLFDGHSRISFGLCENGRRKRRRHSLNVGIVRATDVAIDEIRALVCGHSDLGEDH